MTKYLDFKILKIEEGQPPKELLLRNFSDGEHQFLHTIGICMMLKRRRSLLLLDEPETHFNPSWRAKFIKTLNQSITAGSLNLDNINIHLLKDIILTSHSPFIISDCLPNNVVFFDRDEENKVEARSAKNLGFNTFGASVEYILQRFFKMKNLVSEYSLEQIKEVVKNGSIEEIEYAIEYFGESSIKQFLFRKLYEKKQNL
ncbi:MAG: AAA family ATPase [Chitinophagales bacterium]